MYVKKNPKESLVREPPPRHVPPTGSQWREMLCLQSQWFINLLYLLESPKTSPPMKCVGKICLPSMEPHADGRPTYNGVRPCSPRGSLTPRLSLPSAMQPAARYLPHWLGQTRASLDSVCHTNSQQVTPSTPVTASHVTKGRVEYESM